MEEGQERDSSSDEQRHIIDDDDMEDSPTDSPDRLFVDGDGDYGEETCED